MTTRRRWLASTSSSGQGVALSRPSAPARPGVPPPVPAAPARVMQRRSASTQVDEARTAGPAHRSQALPALSAQASWTVRVGACAGRQLAQQRQLPLADDALGVVGVGAEDPADAALVVRHRAVGEGVVGLLRVAVPLHDEQQRLVVSALVAAHGPAARGPTWSQISRQTTLAGCPSASGCLPPTMVLYASL